MGPTKAQLSERLNQRDAELNSLKAEGQSEDALRRPLSERSSSHRQPKTNVTASDGVALLADGKARPENAVV